MTRLVILPNHISSEIDRRLDAEFAKHPNAAADRELFRDRLIAYVDEHGVIPDFSLERRA